MMKRVLIVLIGITLFVGCKDEQDADPGNSKTFIRYFGGEFDDVAVGVEETSDGFLLLSNTEIPTDQLGVLKFKIKLTKTDLNGNVMWQKSYPEFSTSNMNVKGASLLILQEGDSDTGYMVVGDRINPDNTTDLYLLRVNTDGTIDSNSEKIISDPTYSLSGNSITRNADNTFTILGTLTGNPTDNMFVAKLSESLDVEWSRNYGAGDATVSNKVFTYLMPTTGTPDTLVLWSGTVSKFGQTDVRVILAPANSQTTLFDKSIGETGDNEEAADICKIGSAYAITGSSTRSGDMDIYFSWITASADTMFTKRIGFVGSNDFGNSVCEGGAGAAVILGTIESTDEIGNGDQDYYLIKVDIFGNIIWKRNFGSPEKDQGASVRRTKDGYYLVLGTTVFGGLKKLMLLKVNKDGLLQ